MPTPQQTDWIVEALLADYDPPALAAKNAEARPVPRHYRSPELEALEPWQRAIVFAEARKRAPKRAWVIATLLGWVALCTLVWQFGFGGRTDAGAGPIYLLSALLPQMVLLNLSTRREIRRLTLQAHRRLKESTPRAVS